MPQSITRELAVCECCALTISNAGDSGCRDLYGHTHPTANVPAGTVVTDVVDVPCGPWTCEACVEDQPPYSHRMWVDVLESKHCHTYDRALSAWLCAECDDLTDYCVQG